MEALLQRQLRGSLGPAAGLAEVESAQPVSNLHVLDLRLPWCGQQLRWQLLRDLARPDLAPDLVVDARGFSPLASAELRALLRDWRAGAPRDEAARMAGIVAAALRAFLGHQRERLGGLSDERLAFELGMLEDTGCSELLLTDERDPGGRRACFGVPIRGLDLACAEQLLKFLSPQSLRQQHKRHKQQEQQQQEQQQQEQQQAGGGGASAASEDGGEAAEGAAEAAPAGGGEPASGFVLSAAFRTGPGAAQAAPALQLQAPPWYAAACLPPLPLPAWNLQAPLLEYAGLVRERLQQHLQQHCGQAAARFQMFEELAALFGPPLEVRMASPPPPPAGAGGAGGAAPSWSAVAGGGGGGGAAAGALVGGGGPGVSAGAFSVLHDQQPMVLFVELLPRFPEEQPALTLQSVRRTGPEGAATFRGYPWSPRWPIDEMAARIFNYIRQEAARSAPRLTGGASGSGGGGGGGGGGLGGGLGGGAAPAPSAAGAAGV
ncbi:hypothetical protein Rsub_04668 [Raphidocelis subcapitata]|uniref:BRISC and BRCA1-A complex member 2 n=1 Tax=Raphidocelis subcapitata TaxID=307507 RepID=A0A2V0NWC9_9CHLO|nr:hypothetical protein Rsub_04668 [Raphidocelis subcapitata]|eukprot:GBF91944.1 hypothetical protein Rsub_04668 [Raphidocelis subcapitata]